MPRGILYHYTGGANGLKSMKWFNHPGWGNTGSSCHVMIFDRIPNSRIGDIWNKIDPELKSLFPVPTIILAPWTTGTWHGNWTNNMTLGVECRNVGRIKSPGDTYLGKPIACSKNGRHRVESFSWEQIVSCINIGRLCQAWIPELLDPDWILMHQCVWATKRDAGPAFPIHLIRSYIKQDASTIITNKRFCTMEDCTEERDEWEELTNELRDEPDECFVRWANPTEGTVEEDECSARDYLYSIGFNVAPGKGISDQSFRNAVRWYQRSTGAYAKLRNGKSRVLKPDGVYGPKTAASLRTRLDELGIT